MLTDIQIVFEKDRSLCHEQGTDLDQLGRWIAHPEAVQREDDSFTQEECSAGMEKRNLPSN